MTRVPRPARGAESSTRRAVPEPRDDRPVDPHGRARRWAVILVGATTALAVTLAVARRVAPPPLPGVLSGTFPNGMAYAAAGDGPRTLLYIPGGPGSEVPSRTAIRLMAGSIRPYLERGFTVWMVTRRRGMPAGYAVEDMADDYAAIVADHLGGRVDVVLGESYGGQIAFFLAANDPDRMSALAVVGAAAVSTDWGDAVDRRLAEALRTGRPGDAGAAFLEYVIPGDGSRGLRRVLGPAVGRLLARRDIPVQDVVTEAEPGSDARAALPRISAPTVLICGDEDLFFARDVVEETARLIPDCTLVWYRGLGHMRTAASARVPRDVLAFVDRLDHRG